MTLGGPPRDWRDARAKVDAEGKCRACGRPDTQVDLEAAHVSGRRFDEHKACTTCRNTGTVTINGKLRTCGVCKGRGHQKTLYVDPVRIIPLCGPESDPRTCHGKEHAGTLELLPLLKLDEQLQAVKDFGGIENARVRLAPSAYRSAA